MSDPIPGPAYRLQTRRLIIRCWQPPDAPLLKAAIDASLDHLRPWMPWAAQEPEELQKKLDRMRRWRGMFDLGQDFVYGIFNLEENQVLGGTGLHTRLGPGVREIGYWIRTEYINQGLATEVSAALTKVAFEIEQVRRVEIHCDPANVRSAAVPRKLGYQNEAILHQRIERVPGKFGDSQIWTLFAADYPHSPAAGSELQAFDVIGRRIL